MRKIWLRIISGKKKNIALMLGGIIVMIGLSGCHYKSRGEYMADAVRKDYEQADMMMQSIMETLEAQDANALKELFSPYALKHTENLEEKIEELIEFYPGSDEGFEGDCSAKGGQHYGEWIINGIYTVMSDSQEYEIRFITMPKNDEEPDKVGLYLIEVMTEEAKPEGFKWRNEEDEPGIYVLEPQERHW